MAAAGTRRPGPARSTTIAPRWSLPRSWTRSNPPSATRPPPDRRSPRSGLGASLLLGHAEVGQGAVAVEVDDEPRHLAIAELEHVGSVRAHLIDLNSASLATPAAVDQHEHVVVVERAVLLGLATPHLPGAEEVAPGFRHAGDSRPRAGSGPVSVD